MDDVRSRLREQRASQRRKILIGVIAVLVVIAGSIMLENKINNKIEDVVIMKSSVSEEKATFIKLKKLDTNIIAVKASDGTYRLAFDDCIGCYYTEGKHHRFKNNRDNTGLVCDGCKSEIMYDDIGFLPEESSPYPIPESEIISEDDRFIIPAQYLENKKIALEGLRSGKSKNNYSENRNQK